MTTGNVLFDAPGPRTVARHRLYSALTIAAIVALSAFVVWKMDATGQLAYDKWEVFLTPEFIEVLLVDGLLKTVQMAFGAILFAVVLGLVLGTGKLSEHWFLRWPSWLVVEFFRAVPVLILMIFLFYQFSLGGGISPLWCVVIALSLYNGSVLAEVFRAGINAVPKGQVEAAYAVGMRKTQVMASIQLPQAVKIMLPALISQCVVALKDTSLGYYILAPGLTAVADQIQGEFFNQVQTAIVVTGLYVGVNLLLTWVATWVQKKYVGEKQALSVPMVGPAADQAAV